MASRITPEEIFRSAKAAATKQQAAVVKARDAKTARLKAERLAREAHKLSNACPKRPNRPRAGVARTLSRFRSVP